MQNRREAGHGWATMLTAGALVTLGDELHASMGLPVGRWAGINRPIAVIDQPGERIASAQPLSLKSFILIPLQVASTLQINPSGITLATPF